MKKQLIHAFMLSAFVLTGCEEDTIIPSWKNHGGAKPISITSFYPESGESGTLVNVFAENFSASMSDTYVTFDGVNSEVLQVQPGKITIRVPLDLAQGDYQVALSALRQTVTSAKTFRVKAMEESLSIFTGAIIFN
jgi:uncharacterized protein (TIGR03437 family)